MFQENKNEQKEEDWYGPPVIRVQKEDCEAVIKLRKPISSDCLRYEILNNVIHPAYLHDVKDNVRWRFLWKKISNSTASISKVVAGVSTVLAFASGFFQMGALSFASGCAGATSLVILQYSSYSAAQSKERTEDLNRTLQVLSISPMPYIQNMEVKEVEIPLEPK